MKKIVSRQSVVLLLMVMLISYGCNQDQSIENESKYVTQINFFSEMYSNSLISVSSNISQSINRTGRASVTFDQKQLVENTIQDLNGKYFTLDKTSIETIITSYRTVSLPDKSIISGRVSNYNLEDLNHYSSEQLKIFQPFIDKLLSLEEPEAAKEMAKSFQMDVVKASNLSEEEKAELLATSSGVFEFASFVQNGGIDSIQNILSQELGGQVNGRVADCSVSMRGVWLGAVVGLGAGAIGGAKVGCAGGIVGGPIGFGTGCVGGAVMGGAMGFIGGAALSTVEQLLGSCFR